MNALFFPNYDEVLLIHEEIIRATGGSEGLRDAVGLESALTAAANRFSYETDDLAKLAATYAYRLSQAHAFVDGNIKSRRGRFGTFFEIKRREIECDKRPNCRTFSRHRRE